MCKTLLLKLRKVPLLVLVLCRLQTIFFRVLVLRDIEDRGRDLETILTQYTSLVKPAFEEFCLPVM